MALGVDGDLGSFVITKAVNIQHLNSNATKQRKSLHDGWNPFAESILHGGELGHLSTVIGIYTESFRVTKLSGYQHCDYLNYINQKSTYLVKVTIVAASERVVHTLLDLGTIVPIKPWEIQTGRVEDGTKVKVMIASRGLPEGLVLVLGHIGRRDVQIAFETNQVAHGRDSVVEDYVPTGVWLD